MKYLNKTRRSRILKVKSSLLELEKDFKPNNISINYMNTFEEKGITKERTFAKLMGAESRNNSVKNN